MHGFRFERGSAVQVVGLSLLLALAGVFLLLSAGTGAAARAGSPSKVVVTLGKPSAFKVTIAPKSVPAGTVVFKVTNAGKINYRFKVCTKPGNAPVRTCVGKTTSSLKPGKTVSLTAKLPGKGRYSYLSTLPANAASSGMKGTFVVKPATGGGSSGASGSTAVGAALFKSSGCGACHALAAAHTAGGIGPDLDQLAPSQAAVARQVAAGGGQMPSFAASLTPAQIQDVAAYVYASTHK
jgi:mono/diheme cytochrome c family protein